MGFTALPIGAYEAIYLQDDGSLVRMPILGVMIDEEVIPVGSNDVVRTGATRSGMAHQVEPGVRDLELADNSMGFVGGSNPLGTSGVVAQVDRAAGARR